MDEKKVKRRTSKTRFNRQKRALQSQLQQQDGSLEEVTVEFAKLESLLSELQDRHDDYCETIQDTVAYDKEEEYIQTCIDEFMALKRREKSTVKSNQEPKTDQQNNPARQSHPPVKNLNQSHWLRRQTRKLKNPLKLNPQRKLPRHPN